VQNISRLEQNCDKHIRDNRFADLKVGYRGGIRYWNRLLIPRVFRASES